ncbi:MAG: acyltransferase [Desulfobacterium sp.]|nr:acyltransferase [Desulfobacterium sp.]
MLKHFFPNKFIRSRKLIASINPKLFQLRYGKRMKLGTKVRFNGLPLIDVHKDAMIKIGNRVTLNSENNSYHVMLHSCVKLMADREGAIIEIGDDTRIHGSCLHAYTKVSIGQGCLIAANCNIIDGNGHDLSMDDVMNRKNTRGSASAVIIEDNVWIGTNVLVLPGTHIGHGSVISAASVVKGEIPPKSLIGGNPAIILKRFQTH